MQSNQPDEERAAHGLDDRSEDEDEAEGDECARWVAMRSLAGIGDVGGYGESGAVVRLGCSEMGAVVYLSVCCEELGDLDELSLKWKLRLEEGVLRPTGTKRQRAKSQEGK